MLEMAKNRIVQVDQKSTYGDIEVTAGQNVDGTVSLDVPGNLGLPEDYEEIFEGMKKQEVPGVK
jgi:hypothetical protein